jgi:hypothetical protein
MENNVMEWLIKTSDAEVRDVMETIEKIEAIKRWNDARKALASVRVRKINELQRQLDQERDYQSDSDYVEAVYPLFRAMDGFTGSTLCYLSRTSSWRYSWPCGILIPYEGHRYIARLNVRRNLINEKTTAGAAKRS